MWIGGWEECYKSLETNDRPPFMDEFEKLENDLRVSYDEYVDKFRCLSYLEQQWQELDKNEQQELEERQVISTNSIHPRYGHHSQHFNRFDRFGRGKHI